MKKIKTQKGLAAIDVATAVVIVAIFLGIIANLIALTQTNLKKVNIKSKAVSYAIQEIEEARAEGYKKDSEGNYAYDEKGLSGEEQLSEKNVAQGYHETKTIEDYTSITGKGEKNKVKKITITISYRAGKEDESIVLSTYVAKE